MSEGAPGRRAPAYGGRLVEARIRRCLLLWVVGSALGGVLIAWPDDGDRMFSLSDDHGPSAVDALGIVVAVVCWVPVLVLIVTQLRWRSDRVVQTGAGAALAAAALLVVAIRLDLGVAWVPAVVVLVGLQAAALRRIWATGG